MTAEMVIVGPPRTKSNHTQAVRTPTGRLVILPSKPYRVWFKSAARQVPILRVQSGVRRPIKDRVEVTAIWWRDRDAGDEDNFKKALGDFLQRCGFIANDRLIHWAGECRLDVDKSRPRIEITLRVAEAQLHGG